jgi:hypothetical protein
MPLAFRYKESGRRFGCPSLQYSETSGFLVIIIIWDYLAKINRKAIGLL